jgi:hypothetical protein
MRESKPASDQTRAVDPAFRRNCERAGFILQEAEALGVRFCFSLETEYPSDLPTACIVDLERAIGRHKALILKLLVMRAEAAAS